MESIETVKLRRNPLSSLHVHPLLPLMSNGNELKEALLQDITTHAFLGPPKVHGDFLVAFASTLFSWESPWQNRASHQNQMLENKVECIYKLMTFLNSFKNVLCVSSNLQSLKQIIL